MGGSPQSQSGPTSSGDSPIASTGEPLQQKPSDDPPKAPIAPFNFKTKNSSGTLYIHDGEPQKLYLKYREIVYDVTESKDAKILGHCWRHGYSIYLMMLEDGQKPDTRLKRKDLKFKTKKGRNDFLKKMMEYRVKLGGVGALRIRRR